MATFDVLFIAVTIVIFFAGFSRLCSSWRLGRTEVRSGDLKGLLGYLLGHRRILERQPSGIVHVLVFWGVLFPFIIAVLAQFSVSFPLPIAKLLSFISELFGIFLLLGVVYFLYRLFSNKTSQIEKKGFILPSVILLIIVISGFLAEGARLRLTNGVGMWPTPVGSVLAGTFEFSALFMQIMIRTHFISVLFFLCLLPFTFMRHLLAGSLNVYYRDKGPRGALKELPSGEKFSPPLTFVDLSWKELLDLQACVSCGRCDDYCPAVISGKSLSPRKMVQTVREEFLNSPYGSLKNRIGDDEIWACTTCMACVANCPLYVSPMSKVVALRRNQTMGMGAVPEEARPMLRDIEIYRDVYGSGIANRENWARNLKVNHIETVGGDAGILLWIGCSGAFHPKYQETARAMVRILQAANVPFGTLGKEEVCCGDAARRLGDEELFKVLARKNIKNFEKYNINKILCLCPHGFNILKNEYPILGSKVEVIHYAEFFEQLIKTNKLNIKYSNYCKAAIHDPCYLGRANDIYDPLRTLLGSVPGVEIVELRMNRENALCCGGGGGRMWLHESQGVNINKMRAMQCIDAGVDLVITSCPFCLTMLEDGISALEVENPPKVVDMIDILEDALGRVY